jgi:hypothetical protein
MRRGNDPERAFDLRTGCKRIGIDEFHGPAVLSAALAGGAPPFGAHRSGENTKRCEGPAILNRVWK